MKRFIPVLSLLLTLLISGLLSAQTNEEMQKMREDFENYKKQEKENFRKFVEERDREFAEYVQNEMRNFELFAGRIEERLPGPEKIPRFSETEKIPVSQIEVEMKPRETNKLPKLPPLHISTEKPVILLPEAINEKPKFDYKIAKFNFYGKEMIFRYNQDIHTGIDSEITAENIGFYFEKISKTEYFNLIEQLVEQHNKLNLNDWAYLKLCEKLAGTIVENETEKTLLHWFLLVKSGYKAKVAFYENEISLMVPVEQKLYGLPYHVFNETDYYILNPELKQIYTYKTDYPGANKTFDLSLQYTPNLPLDIEIRKIGNKNLKSGNIDIAWNRNMQKMYSDFPQADLNLFFHSAISPITRESLKNYFDPLFTDKSDIEKARVLLNFVQKSFDYQTDQQQFGKEKFFFPEEVFIYPAADCEDRSALLHI